MYYIHVQLPITSSLLACHDPWIKVDYSMFVDMFYVHVLEKILTILNILTGFYIYCEHRPLHLTAF